MSLKLNPGCCCEEGVVISCFIADDSFDRPDSSSLGIKWIDNNGGNIASQQLQFSTTDGSAVMDAQHPDTSSINIYTEVLIVGDIVGEQARMIVDYVDDENYHYAQLSFSGPSTAGLLEVIERSGGSDTMLASASLSAGTADVGDVLNWETCIYQDEISTIVANAAPRVTSAITAHNGRRAGLGSGSITSNSIHFDRYTIFRHYDNTDRDGFCYYCGILNVCAACPPTGDAPQLVLATFGTVANDALTTCDSFYSGLNQILGFVGVTGGPCTWRSGHITFAVYAASNPPGGPTPAVGERVLWVQVVLGSGLPNPQSWSWFKVVDEDDLDCNDFDTTFTDPPIDTTPGVAYCDFSATTVRVRNLTS